MCNFCKTDIDRKSLEQAQSQYESGLINDIEAKIPFDCVENIVSNRRF